MFFESSFLGYRKKDVDDYAERVNQILEENHSTIKGLEKDLSKASYTIQELTNELDVYKEIVRSRKAQWENTK